MKNKKITLRITETQYKSLIDRIVEQSTTTSGFIRKLLDEEEQNCRKENDRTKTIKTTTNKLLSILKGN
ncbi:MAG: hypothetical protein WCK82_10810 [Bacteroidota bacterium]|jgi:hypothetical protein